MKRRLIIILSKSRRGKIHLIGLSGAKGLMSKSQKRGGDTGLLNDDR